MHTLPSSAQPTLRLRCGLTPQHRTAPHSTAQRPSAPHRSPSARCGRGLEERHSPRAELRQLTGAGEAAGVRRGPRAAGAAADPAPGQAPSSGRPPATSSRCGPGARPPPGTGSASRFGRVAEPHECGSEHKQKGGSPGQSPFWLLGWQSSCAGTFSRIQVTAVGAFLPLKPAETGFFLAKQNCRN